MPPFEQIFDPYEPLHLFLISCHPRVCTGAAIFTFACLLSTQRLLTGVSLVAIVITTVIVVRIVGIIADGPRPESTRLFIPEAIMLILSVAGIVLERARRQNQLAPNV